MNDAGRTVIALGAALGLSGCGGGALEAVDSATLVNADAPNIREAIRVHIREQFGADVFADVDSLRTSHRLVLRRRGMSRPQDADAFKALPQYSLHIDRMGRCFLSDDAQRRVALRLPDSARCVPVAPSPLEAGPG